ncbi:YqiA/YcfP family alpha/beta fold hydrolase [Psychromonas ossibalaenae]|uniref:YqiA/YcfP family alpha/beta fold hydrolase n=1 Tax=Psychromonas ossibalaenae TaxID=444922 RepID=UPI0003717128|nr:YqiA/YcfP family alpha/beta fold hydrolase [Psychromonas ossibalaenae]
MAQILLSLHGFHSSPGSLKAKQMSSYLSEFFPDIQFICPQLPSLPEQMWAMVESLFAQHKHDQIAVMGSSLGGYLAAKAAQQYCVNVVLINPAVYPYHLLEAYAGRQVHPYTGDEYQIDQHFMTQLKSLEVPLLSRPEKCWVLLQKEDEVLDYRQAFDKYKQCKISCEEGGNHSFAGFERYLPDIIKFLF